MYRVRVSGKSVSLIPAPARRCRKVISESYAAKMSLLALVFGDEGEIGLIEDCEKFKEEFLLIKNKLLQAEVKKRKARKKRA
jgi:hypothetical protein